MLSFIPSPFIEVSIINRHPSRKSDEIQVIGERVQVDVGLLGRIGRIRLYVAVAGKRTE